MMRTSRARRIVASLGLAALAVTLIAAVAAGRAASRREDFARGALVAWHGARLERVGGVLQRRGNDCGPAALAHCLRELGHHVVYPDPDSVVDLTSGGCRLDDLAHEAARHGLAARFLRAPDRDLASVRPPAILFLPRRRHFVVWEGAAPDGRHLVHDPAYGLVSYAPGRLRRVWGGAALVFDVEVGHPGTR